MRFNKIIAAIAAAGMIVTPGIASAARAAPPVQLVPAPETVDADGQQQIYGASVILQVGIIVALAIILYFAIDQLGGNGGDDTPTSP